MIDYWKIIFALCGIVLGGLMTCQGGVNSELKTHLSYPIQAAFISFLTGTTVLSVLCLALYLKTQETWFANGFAPVPWWAWTGGLIGAIFVSSAIMLIPRMGAITWTLTLMSGQIFTAMLIEHFGIAGVPKIPINGVRIAGSLLVLTGILLVVLWPTVKSPPTAASAENSTSQSEPSMDQLD